MDIKKLIEQIVEENSKPTIAYSAVVIEDSSEIAKIKKIVEQYIPLNKGWKKPLDFHMTISLGKFPESLYLRGDLNKKVTLKIDTIGISANAIALGTNGYYSKNDIPHITLAFKNEPAASKFIENWEKIDTFYVTGVIREVATGNIVLK